MAIRLRSLSLILLASGLTDSLARRQRSASPPSWLVPHGQQHLAHRVRSRYGWALPRIRSVLNTRMEWRRLRGGQLLALRERPQERASAPRDAETSDANDEKDLSSAGSKKSDEESGDSHRRLKVPERLKSLPHGKLPVPKKLKNLKSRKKEQERLKPFNRGLPSIDIDSKALKEKEVWHTQKLVENVAFTQGVMDVNASASIVWHQLFDFKTYPKKCPVISAAEVYKRDVEGHQAGENELELTDVAQGVSFPPQIGFDSFRSMLPNITPPTFPPIFLNATQNAQKMVSGFFEKFPWRSGPKKGDIGNSPFRMGNALERFFVRFASPILPGINMINYCDMTFEPSKNSITYTLDFDKKNDFKDLQGHWHVAPHPDGSARSRVYYEIALATPRWLPRMVVNKLNSIVVKEATFWVKKESESQAKLDREAKK